MATKLEREHGYYKSYTERLEAAKDKYLQARELFGANRFNAEHANRLLEIVSSSIPTNMEFDLAKKAAPLRMALRGGYVELHDIRRYVDALKLSVLQEIFYDPALRGHGKPD